MWLHLHIRFVRLVIHVRESNRNGSPQVEWRLERSAATSLPGASAKASTDTRFLVEYAKYVERACSSKAKCYFTIVRDYNRGN